MKTKTIQAVLSGMSAALLAFVWPAAAESWRGLPGSTYQEWRFDTKTNPVPAEVSENVSVAAELSVSPGAFSLGWQQQLPGLGSATGYWDLGRSGSIVVTAPGGLGGAFAGAKFVAVDVGQYVDGGIYRQFADVSVPGATLVNSDGVVAQRTAVGGWLVDQTLWRISPGVMADRVVIYGAANGSVIDNVVVQTLNEVIEPTQLSIRSLPVIEGIKRVELSWPASAGDGVIEWTGALGAGAWEPLGGSAQLVGDRYVLVTDAQAELRFFRLKQP